VSRGSVLRGLAYGMAAAFFVSTLLQLADQLNLLFQPPNVPESANLVERVTALIPFREQVWPLFFASNVLLGLGFLILVGLAMALAGRVARSDERRHLLLWTLVMSGVIGAIAQVILVGAVKAAVDIPYCDCGFKDQEIVSQVWAEMVVQSATQVMIYAAGLLAAAGLIVTAAIFRPVMSAGWQLLSWLGAAALLLSVLLGWADVAGDANTWLTAAIGGLTVPIWAIWLGRALPVADASSADRPSEDVSVASA
jgi:hypothetical protein